MVTTRAQRSEGATPAPNPDQVSITAEAGDVSATVVQSMRRTRSAGVKPEVSMQAISITPTSSAQTSNVTPRLIIKLKLPGRQHAEIADTKIHVTSMRETKGKAVERKRAGRGAAAAAAAASRGFKRESTDEDSASSPPKKSKTSHEEGEDEAEEDEFKPDSATTKALGVPTVARVLRGRGEDGTVTGRIRAAEKAKEDLRGTFVALRAANLGQFLKKMKKRRPTTPYTNKQRFKFGHDHLWYWTSPSPYDIRKVSEILVEERPVINQVAAAEGTATNPFHASAGISIDSIVRVILSQACTNEAALDAQQAMLLAYPYWTNGKWVAGQKPNYHAMRAQSLSKLEKVLKKAGLANKKPKAIKDILDIIYQRNVALLEPLGHGEVVYDGNERGAADFVPGLLSVDYFWDIYKQEGKQALLDHLVSLPLIGVKSASCLMCFNMSLPVFAVDTHVAGMAKLLG
ncbi:hypothetical protein AYL99_07439 [Fonsecaea erecta]|uniref:HhH-GPD domain-containing protein n=1 Tax=Fonsecaea erecta TaxID=1367422 RepID=A0A178ZEY5_9EURO|nr:hypothetical protein AYL99_07439 [Fonsecaea erecta]OAP58349.1 hypothetical protein AYL99_07439 [Fonsecaea erecta]